MNKELMYHTKIMTIYMDEITHTHTLHMFEYI